MLISRWSGSDQSSVHRRGDSSSLQPRTAPVNDASTADKKSRSALGNRAKTGAPPPPCLALTTCPCPSSLRLRFLFLSWSLVLLLSLLNWTGSRPQEAHEASERAQALAAGQDGGHLGPQGEQLLSPRRFVFCLCATVAGPSSRVTAVPDITGYRKGASARNKCREKWGGGGGSLLVLILSQGRRA